MNGSHRRTVATSAAIVFGLSASLHAGGGLLFGSANCPLNADPPNAVLADLDDDGLVDLLYTHHGFTYSYLEAIQGTGDGTFQHAASESFGDAGGTPVSLVTADFDGDGRLDAALADQWFGLAPDVRVWLDDNEDGWPPFRLDAGPQVYDFSLTPSCLAAGDVDGDADVDLVLGSGEEFYVLLNDGTGSFTKLPGGAFAGGEVTALAVADLDGDGRGDVVAAKSNRIRRFMSLGGGAFDSGVIVAQDGTFTDDGLRIADIDLDGSPDIVLGSYVLGTSWLEGDGAGGFAAPVPIEADSAWRVLVDDVNADAIPDLVVARTDGLVETLAGHGDGTFTPLPGIELPTAADLTAADVNGDGRRDLVVGAGFPVGLAIVENLGTGRWADSIDVPCAGQDSSDEPTAPALADMDGDGDPDVVVGVFREPRVFLNPGPSGDWPQPLLLTKAVPGARLIEVFAADLDGTLGPDIVGVSQTTPGVHVWLAAGPSVYSAPAMIPLAGDAIDAAVADFDVDGRPDLVVAHVPEVSVLMNDGEGNLGAPVGLPWTANRLAVGDFDGDTIPDLAMLESNSPDPSILRVVQGAGDGSFAVRFLYPFEFPLDWQSLRADDQDGDGLPDLVLGGSFAVSVLHNAGGFRFDAPQTWPSSSGSANPHVAELDGEPGTELVCSGLAVLHQSGGAYTNHSNYGTGESTNGFELADMDADGDLDVVLSVPDGLDSKLVVLPGRPADPWQGLNGGLPGTDGVPELSGTGTLQANTPMGLALVRARASAPAALVVGLQIANLPFKGGTLVPFPQLLVSGLLVHPDGTLHLNATWPGLPPGLKVVLQFWIVDPAGVVGLSASNALAAVAH
jgi:hypothetical protein